MPQTQIPKALVQHLQRLEENESFSWKSSNKISSSSGKQYFAKVGSPEEKDQYIGEVESLNAMNEAASGIAPRVLAFGMLDSSGNEPAMDTSGRPFFLSEYKNMGRLTDQAAQTLGKRLAEMHTYESQKGFGFAVPTYCGATRMDNGWFEDWGTCYSTMIGSLLSRLEKKGRYQTLCSKGEEVRKKVIPWLLGPLEIKPVLLHGDLWSGNTGTDDSTGEPVIFDPSSYYGHNEADLAIGRMFGGIPKSFLASYHARQKETEPMKQYGLRAELYELFHHLNHTLLFGESYSQSSMGKMETLLRAFGEVN